MNKTFKRTLLGAAIASAAMASVSANAYTIGESNDSKVEVYGIVSISAVDYGAKGGTFELENESRVGFRAAQAMTDSVEAFVQIESGWVLDDGADLGNRDTFVGMRGDDWGSVRFGRMLTPMYELVDWPYSASNMGTTFDRGWRSGERFLFDRKSQQVRFDSINYADMVNFSVALGNGSSKTDDSTFYGAKVSVTPVQMLTLHAAFETATDTIFDSGSDASLEADGSVKAAKADSVGDTDSFFAGFELRPMDSVMIAAAYKTGEYDAKDKGGFTYDKREIEAYSVQANYYMGSANFRLGYANQTGETDSKTDAYLDRETLTAEFGYSFNSVYTFLRVAEHSNDGEGDTMVRIGTEWYF
ncbi:porin [Photobacterium lipolyticum]|uniref:Porin n=1 Tax=Photobacterium lipolyticum TaxID=266810 RepID=A0A2T3N597_9GAMM|nr:porin [Photobacterium lipolyticum]PSW07629.1 porin [Photobacterium lipolyticum]